MFRYRLFASFSLNLSLPCIFLCFFFFPFLFLQAIREEKLGEAHHAAGHSFSRLGMIALFKGDPANAMQLLLRAQEILSVARNPSHPSLGYSFFFVVAIRKTVSSSTLSLFVFF